MTITFSDVRLDVLPQVAAEIIESLQNPRVVCLHGTMGAGKTTLVKALISELGAADVGSSPTFALINNYGSETHGTIYHLDLYRLINASEALDIGIEDIIYENVWCFIEWPEMVEHLLPENAAQIKIEVHDDGLRTIVCASHKN
jgi:tRNA threonylcarbamoyladenosine biosynthesis protein TsaE